MDLFYEKFQQSIKSVGQASVIGQKAINDF